VTTAPLSQGLADHFAGPLMPILAVRDDRFRAAIARAIMVSLDAEARTLDIFLAAPLWADFMRAVKHDAIVAVTATHPGTYVSYQVKGRVLAIDPAEESDVARARLGIDRMLALLNALGSTRQQLSHIFTVEGLVRVRMHVNDVFEQTPGPAAGERIGA
jgi:hypothetical protein